MLFFSLLYFLPNSIRYLTSFFFFFACLYFILALFSIFFVRALILAIEAIRNTLSNSVFVDEKNQLISFSEKQTFAKVILVEIVIISTLYGTF